MLFGNSISKYSACSGLKTFEDLPESLRVVIRRDIVAVIPEEFKSQAVVYFQNEKVIGWISGTENEIKEKLVLEDAVLIG
jgi:hypothetical protein